MEGFESWTARNFAEFKKRISGNLTSSNLKPARIQFEWRQKINVIKTWNWYNCRNNQSKFHLQISTRCCEWITLHVYIGISNQWLLNLMLYVHYVHLQNTILLKKKLLILCTLTRLCALCIPNPLKWYLWNKSLIQQSSFCFQVHYATNI